MKRIFMLLSISLLLTACGGSSEKSSESEVLTPEEEAAIVDSVSTTVDQAKEQLKNTTEKNVKEIDSLLNQL
jgi:hypothetical protein